MKLHSDVGASDSHKFKEQNGQTSLFSEPKTIRVVKDILEKEFPDKYECTKDFVDKLNNCDEYSYGIKTYKYEQ